MNNLKTFSASLSNVGRKRQNNEDSLTYCETDDPQETLQSGNLYIVADGVGGAAQGERASRYAAEKVLYDYYQMPETPPGERLRQLIREAGNQIYQYAEGESFGRMATTMVAAMVRDDNLLVAHVGDSRAYLIRGGQVNQLTRDHSLVGEMIRDGTLTEEESLSSKVKNRLTRSLGGEENVPVDVTAEIPLEPGDRILLCTDGLTRYALPADLLERVPDRNPTQAVQSLIDFANSKGGADNVTAIVISVHHKDEVVDWTAAEFHAIIAPQPWDDRETDPSAGPSSYTEKPIQPRRRRAVLGWIPLSVIALLAIVVVWFAADFAIGALRAAQNPQPNPVLSTATQTRTPEPTTTQTPLILTVTPTQNITPTSTQSSIASLGRCEYTVKPGDEFGKYRQNWKINFADVSCKPGSYKCPTGQLDNPDVLYAGTVLIFPNIDPDYCRNTIRGTPVP